MEENINSLITKINENVKQLKQYVEHHFALIDLPSNISRETVQGSNSNKSPLSYMLYGLGGAFLIGAFVSNAKVICLCLAGLSAYGGVKTSQTTRRKQVKISSTPNLQDIKTNISRHLIEINNYICNSWDSMTEKMQKQINLLIDNSDLTDAQKDEKMSKILFHETFNISNIDISRELLEINNLNEIRNFIDKVQSEFLTQLTKVKDKQIALYNSIL